MTTTNRNHINMKIMLAVYDDSLQKSRKYKKYASGV